MKKEHFDLFNEVCLEAGIPLKVVKSMHDFIQKDADANGDGKISREEFANFIKSNPQVFTKKILEDLKAVTRTPHPAVDFEETKMRHSGFDKFENLRIADTGGYGGGFGGSDSFISSVVIRSVHIYTALCFSKTRMSKKKKVFLYFLAYSM